MIIHCNSNYIHIYIYYNFTRCYQTRQAEGTLFNGDPVNSTLQGWRHWGKSVPTAESSKGPSPVLKVERWHVNFSCFVTAPHPPQYFLFISYLAQFFKKKITTKISKIISSVTHLPWTFSYDIKIRIYATPFILGQDSVRWFFNQNNVIFIWR